MRSAYLTFGLLLVLSVACSGQSAPSAPASPSADLPSWSMTMDGVEHSYGLASLSDNRSAAVVKPGTTMSAAELRVYFAVNIVNDPSYGWPSWYKCPVYKAIYAVMLKQSDATVRSWVVTMEANGYDVPDKGPGVPPKPIC